MAWLEPFAAMVMVCSVAAALLPSGTIKKKALMVMGMLLTLCWLACLPGLFRLEEVHPPASVLTETAVSTGQLFTGEGRR